MLAATVKLTRLLLDRPGVAEYAWSVFQTMFSHFETQDHIFRKPPQAAQPYLLAENRFALP